MISIAFATLVAFASAVAFRDWRKGWLLALAVGAAQDPVRKLTVGTPVAISYTVMLVYMVLLIAARRELLAGMREFSIRFPAISRSVVLVVLTLCLGMITGLSTFGLTYWRAPLLSLFTYIAPIPAAIVGFVYLRHEKALYNFFAFYSVITSAMLVGAALEYYRVDFPGLGMVGTAGEYVRFLPGIQLRMISGFYRGPDIMGWHAATLTSIAIAMSVRSGLTFQASPWLLATAWGFFSCLISGRRKAIYFVVAAVAVFVWRYFARLRVSQVFAAFCAAIVLIVVVQHLSSRERVYSRSAFTSRVEVQSRFSGITGTISQHGILGAGLGYATQGVYHLLPRGYGLGWQEGGLAKVTAELGVPGLLVGAILAFGTLTIFLTLTRIGDVPGSSQFARVTLFALVISNVVSFAAAAQAYTDPVLGLLTMFFVGSLFATATLDERLSEEPRVEALNSTLSSA